ncbi:type II toxin-antitoxin system RelE/ParE family toxin [Xanthomonas sp. LMG 9002]|uniref:type II toxin-antitoxin system RelE/ParE family toxin n=1 Tax=Xanthomonas sp. LMG 9002 TaxID=1591158 RepID=UPI001F38AE92|nr:type II toxin-antitoxin system RelE/ParE family toxin [Xanthomonas sp. LMG 9002]
METTLDVRFYRAASGVEPVRVWLKEDVSADARRAIGDDIKTVQLGWPLGMPLVRKLDQHLWEVRSAIPEGIARIFSPPSDRTWCCCMASSRNRARPRAPISPPPNAAETR